MPFLPLDPFFVAVDEMMGESSGTPFVMGGDRTYIQKFLVQTRVRGLHPIHITRAPYLPIGGAPYVTPYDYDLLAILRKKSAEPQTKNDWQNWIVTCEFSTKIKTKQEDSSQNQPELERPDVEWDFDTIKISPQRDLAKKPLLNSANMPFSPPPTFDVGVPVLNIVRNELAFNVQKAQTYAYALNNATFLGYPELTVQCLPPKAKQMWKGSYRFWKITYKLRFAPQVQNLAFDPDLPEDPITNPKKVYYPWQPRLLDQGMYRLDDDPASPRLGKPTPIWAMGHPVHHPVLLDGVGQEADESPPLPRFIDFAFYPSRDFTALLVEGLTN